MPKIRIIWLTILTLIFSSMSPLPAAVTAEPQITKTVTVKKADNTAYAGALVALTYYDPVSRTEGFTTPVSANSSGVASLQVPASFNYYSLIIQPEAGDLSHALYSNDSLVITDANQSFSATLAVANLKVLLKNSNGTDAGPMTFISFPGTGYIDGNTYRSTIRSGAFGINLATSLVDNSEHVIEVFSNSSTGGFYNAFGLKTSKPSDVFTPVLYKDLSFSEVLNPVANSIYELSLKAPNVVGQLKKADGTNLTLGTNVTGGVSLLKADGAGAADHANEMASANINSDGSWNLYFELPSLTNAESQSKAGKYVPFFYFAGSKTLVPFYGAPFWIDESGKFSTSATGPFETAAPFSFSSVISSATPNFVVNAVVPNSTLQEPSYIQLFRSSSDGGAFGAGMSLNGVAAWALADGDYNLFVSPTDPQRLGRSFTLIVAGGVAKLSGSANQVIQPGTNGEFTVSGGLPNLKIRVTNPNDPNQKLTGAYAYGWDEESGYDLNGNQMGDGTILFDALPGVYDFTVYPNNSSLVNQSYVVTVTTNSISITNEAGTQAYTAVGGYFNLPAGVPNVTATLTDSAGTQITSYVSARVDKFSSGKWVYYKKNVSVRDGKLNAQLEVGKYRFVIYPQNSSSLANTTTAEFDVTNAGAVLDLGAIALEAPLFKIQTRAVNGTENLTGGEVRIYGAAAGFEDYLSPDETGMVGISVPSAGTYQITLYPPYSSGSTGPTQKSYTLTVTESSGVLTPTISGVTKELDNSFVLRYGVPNVTGKIFASNGDAFTTGNGRWAHIQFQKWDSVNQYWQYVDTRATVGSDGSFGANLETNGTYRFKVQVQGLANSATTFSEQFEVTDSNRTGTVATFNNFVLKAPLANIKVRSAGSTSNLIYSEIEIRKDNKYVDWIYTDEKGIAKLSVESAGTYQLVVHPDGSGQGISTVKTYTAVVTGTTNLSMVIQGATTDSDGSQILYLGTPNVTGKIVDSTGAGVASKNGVYVSINAQKLLDAKSSWQWTNSYATTRADGTFGLSVTEPGTYRLRIEPSGRPDFATTYSQTFEVTTENLASFTKNFAALALKAPTLKGTVTSPGASTAVQNSQVIAINDVTGQEMWEYSRGTNSAGEWTMVLPAGKYSIYARAPWGQLSFGASDPIAGLTVNADGAGTFSGGQNPSALTLQLANATWSGTAVQPGTSVTMDNISICFGHGTTKRTWTCTETNSQGAWALSKPFGFTGFDDSSELQIREYKNRQFAEKRLVGKTAIEAVLGAYTAGQTYSGITLSPQAPNFEFTVKAGSSPAANVWVNLDRPNVGWLGGGLTDADGKVKFYIENPTAEFNLTAQADGNSDLRGKFATTRKTYQYVANRGVDSIFSDEVSLSVPNFMGFLYEPPLTAGDVANKVQWSWMEIRNDDNYEYLGTNTDNDGFFSTLLKAPSTGTFTYTIKVRPRYGSSSMFSDREYKAVVNTAGAVTLTEATSGAPVALGENSQYNLFLGKSSARGTVYLPDGVTSVSDSWVVPFDIVARQDAWKYNTRSNNDGTFGMALPNGEYRVQADTPWQMNQYTKSAACSITVANGQISTANNDCVTNGELKLKLREPNLKFKLVKPKVNASDPDVPVANAYVSVSVGSWYTSARSGSDGQISLFVDSAEIANRNPGISGTNDLHIWVDSSGQSDDIVRWNCRSGDARQPLCKDLTDLVIGQPYLTTQLDLGSVQFKAPNITLQVNKPDGQSVGSGAWVNIFKEETGWKRYLSGAGTNSAGKAVFNIENNQESDRYTVEINAPWSMRNQFAQTTFENKTFAQITSLIFALTTPNLTLNIKQPNGTSISKWAWAQVERVDSTTFAYTSWLGGFGSDEFGALALNLPVSGTYRITVNPGPASLGTRTSCVVSTDGTGLVSRVAEKCFGQPNPTSAELNFTLSSGNVQGYIYRGVGTDPLEGAVVIAESIQNGVSVTQTSNSDAAGKYGFQLDPTFAWTLRVAYINQPTATVKYLPISTPETLTGIPGINSGSSLSKNFNLSVAP